MIELDFYEGEDWFLQGYFEEIKKYRKAGIYSISDQKDSDGYVDIYVSRHNFDKPRDFQQKAITYFYENQKEVLMAFCHAILLYYAKLISAQEAHYFPELKTIADIEQSIGFDNIHVLQHSKSGIAYLGFVCGCQWDEEHGLGVIMHKERVIDIGFTDLVFSASEAVRIDNGSYLEERVVDEISQKILNRKWWQFWIK